MTALLRDPLAHFLIAGAAIWGVLAFAGDPVDPEARSITLSREQQAGLALAFERTMNRPPTDAELDARIAQWIREEVLYREALRLGLDTDDPVVKRRLATKMDELAGAQAELAQPSEADLREWYRDHGAEYETGGSVSFEQAWFPTEEAALAARGEGQPRGEPISLPRSVAHLPGEEIERLFGIEFAEAVHRLSVSPEWQGPLRSGYGWHLVRLSQREKGSIPPLDEVRQRVVRDWRSQTVDARREQAYELLHDAYTIEVE